ncbi:MULTISPECIES: diguanylate cyclase domain-containing protein [Burkholderia]|nr:MULTISPECIES: diguanylate cyclase [unclassified Burkholderia]
MRLGVRVGIAMLPDDGTDVNALIEHADQAMYEPSARGRNGRPARHA